MEKISNTVEIVKSLPDYAPIPKTALGPALNEQGYYVGRVERNLYWVTDGVYQSAFLTTKDGVILLDAPPTIGHNIQRAVDKIASDNGVSNKITHLIYSHHHAAATYLFPPNGSRMAFGYGEGFRGHAAVQLVERRPVGGCGRESDGDLSRWHRRGDHHDRHDDRENGG